MTLKIEAGKKYRTRGGDEVEILRTDVRDKQPVVGIFTDKHGDQEVCSWTPAGFYFSQDERSIFDLISEVKPKRVVWLNVYGGVSPCYCYSTRKEADRQAGHHRIACIRVEFEENQFDD